jgi:orotidine-5'-phosphate decarboxylase
MNPSSNPVYCAIDTNDLARAEELAIQLHDYVGGIKLGLEFFMAHGRAGYQVIAKHGRPIFLDLKLHDIPNTVAGAVASLAALNPAYLTVHAAGGADMMRAAVEAVRKAGAHIKILAVTVLTSLNGADLAAIGQGTDTTQQVIRLAHLAKASGLDGVICSPDEIMPIRSQVGHDFTLMVPGIRPSWAKAQDQKRVKTPRQAMDDGATHLVIGRPITASPHPADAAKRVLTELAGS